MDVCVGLRLALFQEPQCLRNCTPKVNPQRQAKVCTDRCLISLGKRRIGPGVVRIQFDGLLKMISRFRIVCWCASVVMGQSKQVGIVGCDIIGSRTAQAP